MKKNESGRSMVEMVGVLAVAGLLTAAAFVLIHSGINNQKISQMRDEIDTLASNTRGLVAESNNTCSLPLGTGTGWQTLGKTLAKALLKSEANNPYGGYYSVVRTGKSTKCADETSFMVYVIGLPVDVCTAMGEFAYSGNGNAVCDNGLLKITYPK